MKKVFYATLMWTVRLTWGLLDTLVGFFIFLFFCITSRPKIGYIANTIIVEVPIRKDIWFGFSSGAFIFSNTNSIWHGDYLLCHEWGHSWPQLLLCGPLHPFVVTIPSIIRFWWRAAQERKGRELPPYDNVWFEATATQWGIEWFNWGVEHGLWAERL